MLKRALIIVAALVMIAMLIDDPLGATVEALGTLIWSGDEGQGHPKPRTAFPAS